MLRFLTYVAVIAGSALFAIAYLVQQFLPVVQSAAHI